MKGLLRLLETIPLLWITDSINKKTNRLLLLSIIKIIKFPSQLSNEAREKFSNAIALLILLL
jgi:hypothetical protein